MSIHGGYHEQEYATPSKKVRQTLRSSPAAALELPDPDETFSRQELLQRPHWTESLCSIATANDILVIDEYHVNGSHSWSVNDDVYAWVVDTIDPPTLTPCGHQGIRCVEAGETYTCSLPDAECDERFGREAAEAVISGD